MPHGYTKAKPQHHKTIPSWALQPTRVPIGLLRAILKAAFKYHVPPDLLAGIWREESGSTYPNPAVNSSGYGGLFGTKDYNGTTQAQADLAASILRAGLIKSHGNIPEALSYYNSGRLQGGYTSVPGQVSHGTVPGYGGKKGGGGGVVSWLTGVGGDVAHAGSTALNVATNPVGTLGNAIFGGITGGIAGAIKEAALKVVEGAAIAGGGFVFILGFVLIAADIGLSTRAGKVAAAIPAGRVITSAARTKTSKPKSNLPTEEPKPDRREERAEEAHQSRLKTDKARRKKLKTETKHRRKTVKEQGKAEEKAYYRGATDAASPTMANIRRSKKK